MSSEHATRPQGSHFIQSYRIQPPFDSGIPAWTSHFGLLDVPPPGPDRPLARLAGSSIDQPQCAGTAALSARDSLETAVQPNNSVDLHSLGSARSRDAAASLGRSGRSASDIPGSSTPSGRPIRPKALAIVRSGGDSRGKATPPPSQRNAVVPLGGVEACKLEGSATSDENLQPRLVPRRGAGPELRREGGGKIDEYLMRLLRNGSSHFPETFHGPKDEVAAKSDRTASDPNEGLWQGSRLGPLAPGAGIKLSSVPVTDTVPSVPSTEPLPPPSSGVTDVRPTAADDPEDNDERPEAPSPPSTPSTTGAETSLEPLQKSQSVQFGNRGTSDRAATTDNPSTRGSLDALAAAAMNGGSSAAPALAERVKGVLGDDLWRQVQSVMAEQSRELDRQVQELHRLALRHQQLHAEVLSGRHHASLGGSSQGSRPPLFIGQSLPPTHSQQQANGNAWWLNTMPWAGFSSASASDNANSRTQALPEPNNHPQGSVANGQQQLSRTTQMALDAQRRRRDAKVRVLSRPGSETPRSHPALASELQRGRSTGQSGLSDQGVPEVPVSEQQRPSPNSTWFSMMSPYLHGGQGAPGAGPPGPMPPGKGGPSLDPLSAWYHYHFGQHPGFRNGGAQPPQTNSAAYGTQLAGMATALPERGWENNCNKYFNFSMQGTSDNKTANTGRTSSRQQPSFAHNQAVSTPRGLRRRHALTQHGRDELPTGPRDQ